MICRTLGELGDPNARDALIGAVSDTEGLVRVQACRALGKVGKPEDVTVLARIMVVDTLEDCRIAAIDGLGELKSKDPRIMQMLVAGMEHEDPAIRLASLKACGASRTSIGESTPLPGATPSCQSRRRHPPAPPATIATGPPDAAAPPDADGRRGVPPLSGACLLTPTSTFRGRSGAIRAIMVGRRTAEACAVSPEGSACVRSEVEIGARGVMDTHTLELLEFDKVRALVAARAACSLGKEPARRMEPSRDPGEIREPPGADDRDGRGARRRG